MVGESLRSEVQHCYKLRSRVPPPPNAFMQFTQEKKRSVAATNVNEGNGRLCSRLAKLWRPLRAADKEPFQRKVAEAATVRRRKYSDYAHIPREASRPMEQERFAKQVTSKLKNGSSWDKEQQPRTSTVEAHGRGSPEFQQQLHTPPLPPTPKSKHRGTISIAPVGASGAGQKTVARMPTATVPATTKDLEGQVVPIKVAALRAFAELFKRQPQHFHNYAELTLIKIFGTFMQPVREVTCAAELCSVEAAAGLPPKQTMRLLHSLIGESDDHRCNQGHVPARGSASKKG
ncbi:transcription factor SOX-7-like [Dermacentor silvarum]|uniref:transcription factor SOX-7-like n=1 Tax=Dermacentor silvarum TaxID=543639 RepID=UPI001899ACE4|nr:transcription factor SOX-7-like [Dermacentor silvarum]